MWCSQSAAMAWSTLSGNIKRRSNHHATALIEMRMQQAGAETVAHGENHHGSFVVAQSLAADDGFGIGDQIPMADHDETRNAGGTGSGHQCRQIRGYASSGRHHFGDLPGQVTLQTKDGSLVIPSPRRPASVHTALAPVASSSIAAEAVNARSSTGTATRPAYMAPR